MNSGIPKTLRKFCWIGLLLTFAGACAAATPALVSYQGRVLVSGAPFTGTGKFRFALLDGANIVWNSDSGGTTAPTTDISIAVSNGLYSVLIGNTVSTGANPYTMAALPASIFANNNPLSLRVFFGDGTGNGTQALTPDQPVTAVGYAMTAATVNGGPSNITSVDASTALNVTTTGTADIGILVSAGANSSNPILVSNAGLATTAFLQTTNAANGNPSLTVTSNGSGASIAASNSGAGAAGNFVSTNAANGGNTLQCTNQGNGAALFAEQDGTANIAFFAITGGTQVSLINRSGNLVPPSDIRLKKNIATLTTALDNVTKLRGVSFEWRNSAMESPGGTKTQLGFIAQELMQIYPEAVQQTDDGYYHANYTALVPALTEAIKELKSQRDEDARNIEALAARNADLEKQNAALEARLSALEKATEK